MSVAPDLRISSAAQRELERTALAMPVRGEHPCSWCGYVIKFHGPVHGESYGLPGGTLVFVGRDYVCNTVEGIVWVPVQRGKAVNQ